VFQKFLDLLFRDSQLNVYAGELEVRPSCAHYGRDGCAPSPSRAINMRRTDAAHERAAQGLI